MRNKRKLKEEQGITLVALIITIIVLVILAAVAITTAYNTGIIEYAIKGTQDYAKATINENKIMSSTEDMLSKELEKIHNILEENEEPITFSIDCTEYGGEIYEIDYYKGKTWREFCESEKNLSYNVSGHENYLIVMEDNNVIYLAPHSIASGGGVQLRASCCRLRWKYMPPNRYYRRCNGI